MFSFDVLGDDGIIRLTVSGQTMMDDYQSVAPAFYAEIRGRGLRKALVDVCAFEGWSSEEARSLAFDSWLESRRLLDRIAVVARDRMSEDVASFLHFFRSAEKDVQAFDAADYDAALAWLKD